MKSFSQRIGKTTIKSIIQREEIDDDLKNALWNAVIISYWSTVKNNWLDMNPEAIRSLLRMIWLKFFKNRLDEEPRTFKEFKEIIKTFFFNCQWYEVYDFLEFIPSHYNHNINDVVNVCFSEHCNNILEKELSAYRFVNGKITPITSSVEIESIEDAITITDNLKPVNTHLKSALELFSDRKTPDYRNSIKESISAVESYCSILIKDPKATLGQALKQIEKNKSIHPALVKAFRSLYGYTSDADGIRHALLDEDNLNQEDAKFMLVACSAFINYLIQKESKNE